MSEMKSYSEVLSFLYEQLPMFQRIGPQAYKKDLTNTLKLNKAAGYPDKQFPAVHIAGTNGKGTVTHLVAAGLQAQGLKVGVYTSPHYKDFRERIKINGKFISRSFVVKFVNRYLHDINAIHPSFFEMTVIMALSYFAEKKVDIAIIETGLGGRLDSTNIITPVLSVITNISYDHQNLLGDTLDLIAMEKAGIIKPGVPVVIGERQPGLDTLFLQKADECQSQISFASDHLTAVAESISGKLRFKLQNNSQPWLTLDTDLAGPFQSKNMVTAFWALQELSGILPLDWDKIVAFMPGFRQSTAYMGRWQIMATDPLVIADSAHNEGGLSIVLDALSKLCASKIHFVLGFVNDKDLSKVLSLFPPAAEYYFAKANIPRGLNAADLKKVAKIFGLNGKAYSSVKKALAAARVKASKNDVIFVGGSIFVVAEIL